VYAGAALVRLAVIAVFIISVRPAVCAGAALVRLAVIVMSM
jgi:hypothetical protein